MNTKMHGTEINSGGECVFKVWAPKKEKMILHLTKSGKRVSMTKNHEGYFEIAVGKFDDNEKYLYCPDDVENGFPDPASHFQPDGVHGPSQVVNHQSFTWKDQSWKGIPAQELILYELHIGTFTPEGTFEAAISRLDDLYDLGVNAIEIMPVSQFPGNRNWGYDGVYPFAVQNSYGGPEGLKKLVNACHEKGIAVILDVVYNHLGPEGNYLHNFGPYFTNQYKTPWGEALNFDGDWSDGVRKYFCDNALHWFEHYHLDGLRLDAIHMAFDNGAEHFWQLLNSTVNDYHKKCGRPLHMIAESDLNSPKVIKSIDGGGYDFSAQWLDDFHHALYTMVDEKGKERYIDFGLIEQLAKAYKDGFVHSGEYVKFRKRKHGQSSAGISGEKFVAFNLNHDQVGNRVHGERLCVLVDDERLKVAAAALFLAPYIPMLFMGEEYADRSPFYYFVSHSDKKLIEAVRKGRKEEFKDFIAEGEPPDPASKNTFQDSVLQWEKRKIGSHQMIWNWHKKLIQLRKTLPALLNFSKNDISVFVINPKALAIHRQAAGGSDHVLCLLNFSDDKIVYTMSAIELSWKKILDSRESEWNATNDERETMPQTINGGDHTFIFPLSVVVYAGSSTI